ncbi:MAG: Toxin-antitoxin system [Candidatus Gottesmanbacteria bacterium GW2011_GWC2_39_8]|uniref:Toxin-antitoxin system n=1 Tax=Candidatus Gottesmanbacteria bacterium GW2011_GWC2_39_8 TaxID=1618450 RepID=A0A0G0SBN3_9BACT|nr:MAG: Toxin-antitoxin system [Candidatus Gottesmanbacteria bacterium GW2011_GWC2_39_8]
MKTITIVEVQYIAYQLAKEKLEFDEPIPPFSSRFPNILESCLAVPFQKFSKKDVYHGIISKAAILFYLLIKNHPFQNGNKRIATTTMFVFLYKNRKWIEVDNQELYNFAIWVAGSPAKLKKEVLSGIEKFLSISIRNIE